MAIYCGDKNSAHLLSNMSEFKERCLIQGRSLFTKLAVWNSLMCQELIDYFVENLDEGDGDFFEKLETQLAGASPEAKVLASEMLWLMFLCPSNTGPESKRKSIERVFSWSGHEVTTESRQRYLSDSALTGIGSAGTAYNTGRWRELVYVIRLVEALLKLSELERKELLSDVERLPRWLESIPENGSRQFRHMFLYLLFPDAHERIFGSTDRKSILTTLSDITSAQYNRMDTKEADAKLLALRQSFEAEYGTQELDYYVEPLRSKWKQPKAALTGDIKEPGQEYDVKTNDVNQTLNTILYGPPGTGKTYTTINKALQIVAPDFYLKNKGDREKLKCRFDELLNNNRIGFVTFHQSFSYEDFVEGLKASTTEDKQISYDVEDGIFKSMCNSASVKATVNTEQQMLDISNRKIWKMSLGDTSGEDAFIYQQCIENNYVLLGYGYDIDFSNTSNRKEVIEAYRTNEVIIEKESSDYRVTSVNNFKNEMSIGDLVVISDGNRKFRAIAEITSDYIFDETLVSDSGYSQVRKVTWHRVYEPSLPVDELFKKNLSQMTLYRLYGATIDLDKLQGIFSVPSIEDKTEINNDRVLIIDEINRGNISSIFGELITLIEPSKRSGGTESLSVKLPYSKETFSVPSNLHIIGTMNTADKSLAQLDIALRRRFEFVEMMTNYELLKGIPDIEGINVAKLVKTMNQRIELLYDREHTIGHSFFLPLFDNPSLQLLAEIFELQILPLLEEYFFEDWERVGQVLGDHLKDNHELRFVIEQFGNSEIAELMGDDWEVQGIQPYCRNQKAFKNPQAYIGVYTR